MDTILHNATIGAFAQAAGVGVETIRFRCAAGSGKVSCPIIASLRGPVIPTAPAAAQATGKR